jgi:regulator of sirC expression with transglutaminase-like and TPR domain
MSEEFMADRQKARQAFTTLITGNETNLDLARAALLIAAEEYAGLEIESYLNQLEELAERVRLFLKEKYTPMPTTSSQCLDVLHALNTVLFEQERFHGSRLDYYNPQNSFFNRVLERRQGIPLTLSLLYMEVGKRLNLKIDGIGLPFHFIVCCTFEDTRIYIDPYEKGKFLSVEDCRRRIAQIFKNQADFDPHWFEPLSSRQLLIRMLVNLKHIYTNKKDFQRALTVCDRIFLLDSTIPIERRDRGVIHFQLKYYARALRDLNAYLELEPQADDIQEVRQQMKVIRQMLAMMN